MNAHRMPALVVLVALLLGSSALAVADPEERRDDRPTAAPSAMALAGESSDLWFCLGPTIALDGVDHRVVEMASISAGPTDGRVIVVDDRGRAVERAERAREPGSR